MCLHRVCKDALSLSNGKVVPVSRNRSSPAITDNQVQPDDALKSCRNLCGGRGDVNAGCGAARSCSTRRRPTVGDAAFGGRHDGRADLIGGGKLGVDAKLLLAGKHLEILNGGNPTQGCQHLLMAPRA